MRSLTILSLLLVSSLATPLPAQKEPLDEPPVVDEAKILVTELSGLGLDNQILTDLYWSIRDPLGSERPSKFGGENDNYMSGIMSLLDNDSVRKELGIEDFQFDEFSKLRNSIRSELNKEINLMIEDGVLDGEQLKARMAEIRGDLVSRFRESLLPEQEERLRQVAYHIQMRRRSVIDVLTTDPLAKELELTETQKKALRKSAREIEEEFAVELAKLREQAKQKLFSNLSRAQQRKLSEILGEEFTLSEARQGNLLRINSSVPSSKSVPAGKPK
jgi:hypothetical protein